MRHGRGFGGGGRGMRRMHCAAGQSRRSWGYPVFTTLLTSLLPAIWEAFVTGRENSRLKNGLGSFANRIPAANERIPELEEPAEQNVCNHDSWIEKGAEKLKAQVNKNLCSGCGVCEAECPAGAITVSAFAEVNEKLCTGCGACVEVCPLDALSMK